MASKSRFDQLKSQIERLRKDALGVVTQANKIVYDGVQKLADKELKALNDYYKSALASIKTARRSDGIKGMAQKQLDLLQDTANQVIANARESLNIVAEARAELAKLMQNHDGNVTRTETKLKKAVAPAKKALEKTKAGAKDAGKKAAKTAKTAVKVVKTPTKKAVKVVEAAVKEAAPAKKAKAPTRARRAATAAVEAITEGVDQAKEIVAEIVDNVK